MVGFIDSGIGGISILNACREALSGQEIVYLCDNRNSPYGEKSEKQIRKITLKNTKKLIKKGCSTIVLACNTATSCSIGYLRKKLPHITFIGTEPNIKGPLRKGYKKIAVLCTAATAKHNKVLKTFDGLFEIICPDGLAMIIENGSMDIKEVFKEIDCSKYDAVVIGCTHYTFVQTELQKLFINAEFFDSREGVVKRIKTLIHEIDVVCTRENIDKTRQLKNILNISNL